MFKQLFQMLIVVHFQVRTLIRDYLVDEQRGSAASRNPINSINEVLRDGKFNRDRIKVSQI
jgi:exocyst complex component 4